MFSSGVLHQKSSTEKIIHTEIDCTTESLPTSYSSTSTNTELHNGTAIVEQEENCKKGSKREMVDDIQYRLLRERNNEYCIKSRRKAKERRKKVEEMIKEKLKENNILDVKLRSSALNYNYWKKIGGASKAYEVKEHLWKFALNLKNIRK